MAAHIRRLQRENLACLAVCVHDCAVFIEKEYAVVHGIQDEVQFLIFRLSFVDFMGEISSKLINGMNQDIELIACAVGNAP